MRKRRNKGLRKKRNNEPPRYRPFDACLWCGKTPIPDPTYLQVNYFCDMKCSNTAMRCLRLSGLSNQRGGAGVQAVLVGLLLQTLRFSEQDGLTGRGLVEEYYDTFKTDWGKRFNSRMISSWFKIYIRPECYHSVAPATNKWPLEFHFDSGVCLKDWLKPKYAGWLTEYYDTLK